MCVQEKHALSAVMDEHENCPDGINPILFRRYLTVPRDQQWNVMREITQQIVLWGKRIGSMPTPRGVRRSAPMSVATLCSQPPPSPTAGLDDDDVTHIASLFRSRPSAARGWFATVLSDAISLPWLPSQEVAEFACVGTCSCQGLHEARLRHGGHGVQGLKSHQKKRDLCLCV